MPSRNSRRDVAGWGRRWAPLASLGAVVLLLVPGALGSGAISKVAPYTSAVPQVFETGTTSSGCASYAFTSPPAVTT